MSARKYGSEALDPTKDRDAEGNLPPEELTDEQIAQRLSEKIALQAELSRTRGTRSTGSTPTAQPIAPAPEVDPVERQQLDAELAEAQAAIAGLEAAEKEAKKQEAAIIARADAERKDRRQALQAHAEEIRTKVAEVERRACAQKLEELSLEHAGAAQRNAARAEGTMEAQRVELQRIFEPILAEIKATLTEATAFRREHGSALEKLATVTFSTSDASFPVRTRQKLSAEVYRPAERLLEAIASVLRNQNEHGGRWDESIDRSIREGKLVTGSSLAETKMLASRCTREHVRSWERTLAQIVLRLDQLTEQGKREAIAPPQITITIDDRDRHSAKQNAMLGKMTSDRQDQAVIHEAGERY